MKKTPKNHFWNIALFTRFNLSILKRYKFARNKCKIVALSINSKYKIILSATCRHEYVGALHGGHQLAGHEAEVPLAPVQALDQGGRDADHRGRDPRHAQVQDVQILRSAVSLLPCRNIFN